MPRRPRVSDKAASDRRAATRRTAVSRRAVAREVVEVVALVIEPCGWRECIAAFVRKLWDAFVESISTPTSEEFNLYKRR